MNRRLLFILLGVLGITAVAYGTILWNTTGRGRPICFATWAHPSANAILRQGVWSHLQARPSILAVLDGSGHEHPERLRIKDPTAPIDDEAVDRFLLQDPECCRIAPLGAEWRKTTQAMILVANSSKVRVYLKDKSLTSKDGFPVGGKHYLVDACWRNLE